MLRRVKIMLHVVQEKNYWLLIIKYISKIRSIFASFFKEVYFRTFRLVRFIHNRFVDRFRISKRF